MGATRKLQGEIDRVLKKVQEGVEVFDSIWNKVYDTENANQKEKFEADLKKEIKKLQRYRDQIKTWIQSSEIKDKKVAASYEQALLDARKQIEREMERFKVCEKETKTKAFSKEGLGQQPKTDPREKAKTESREWLNNMVSELESQIDSFEAETEGLAVKKGKTRPPRLIHLEESIARHKNHIMKLELILRLLDNDELGPEQVNDVKDLVEDYVERNQDDFDDFDDVDEIYNQLPLDKMEAMESLDAIPNVASAIVVKEKAAVAAASGAAALNGGTLKSSLPTQAVAAAAAAAAAAGTQVTPVLPPLDDAIAEASADTAARTSPIPIVGAGLSPTSAVSSGSVQVSGSDTVSSPTTPSLAQRPVVTPPGLLTSARTTAKTASTVLQSSPVSLGRTKEEDIGNLAGRRVGPGMGDGGLSRSFGRPTSVQATPLVPLSIGGALSGSTSGTVPTVSDVTKRSLGDERTSGGLPQQLTSPLSVQNRAFMQSGKLGDSSSASDSGGISEGGIIGNRLFTPPVGQWRPHSASAFQSPGESGHFHGRAEIAPDQKQKFLQKLQQVNQQGHSAALLSAATVQHLSNPAQKQQLLSSPQTSSLVQQALLQQQQQQQQQQQHASAAPVQVSQSASLPQQTAGLQAQPASASAPQAQPQVVTPQPSQQLQQVLTPGKDTAFQSDVATRNLDQQQQSPVQQPKLADDTTAETNTPFSRNLSLSEDDLKNADTFDVSVGGPGTLAELSQLSRDADFTPGQQVPLTPTSSGPGVIGRKSGTELGAIGDNLSTAGTSAAHDHMYNLQMLEAAYRHIPLPKDSERPRSYVPRNPAVTPGSYPQIPSSFIDNPALWEKFETDVLFFAFYYQQGTYQQYLAARELKKQSWRYHKKYNTWFQRHEEPKVTTDEYEQGTYVYFDFHIVDDLQQGWVQRIKTEFTFEYSYLEDELVV